MLTKSKRAALATLGCLLFASSVSAATVVQTKEGLGTPFTSTPTVVAFDTNVTTGNAVIVVVTIGGTLAGTSTIAASDATNGAYTSIIANGDGAYLQAAIIAKRNLTGGFVNVSVTSSIDEYGTVFLYEVSGLDTTAAPVTGSNSNATVTSHTCTSSGLSGTGFSVCGSQALSGFTTTQGTGWTKHATAAADRFSQYRTGTVSSNTGPFTTGTADTTETAMAVFADAGAAVPCTRMLLGIGRC